MLTHGNLAWVGLNCIVDYDVVSTDIALMISPLFHVASLGMGALPVILKGATIVLEKRFEPGRALAQIERHGVTMLSGVPPRTSSWPTIPLGPMPTSPACAR